MKGNKVQELLLGKADCLALAALTFRGFYMFKLKALLTVLSFHSEIFSPRTFPHMWTVRRLSCGLL
jgi:hypothetical protein